MKGKKQANSILGLTLDGKRLDSALLKRGDETVGAVGVSGATPQQDEELAQAAADAFARA